MDTLAHRRTDWQSPFLGNLAAIAAHRGPCVPVTVPEIGRI